MALYCSSSSRSCVPSNWGFSYRLPSFLFLVVIGLFLVPSTNAQQQSSPFPSGPEKQAHLHFFFHDILSGSNPTAIQVINSPSGGFGDVVMVDNPLTETLDSSSKLVGRAQGFYASASQSETALMMLMNYVFLDGDFKGSSLAIFGRNPVMDSVREMSVVGGSGKLRMARGYALAQTRSFGPGGNAVVEYDVYVAYYENPGAGEVITTPSPGSGGSGSRGGRGVSSGAAAGAAAVPAVSWLGLSVAVAVLMSRKGY